MTDQRKFNLPLKKHGRFHRANPFNILLHRHLSRRLGATQGAPQVFTSTVLNQGETEQCTNFGHLSIIAAITKKIYDTGKFWLAELGYIGGNGNNGVDVQSSWAAAVSPGFTAIDGSIDHYDAFIWIKPVNGMDLYDSIDYFIQLYKSPAGGGIVWLRDWDNCQNGILSNTTEDPLGPHFIVLCGKTPKTLNSGISFPEPDRMTNQGTWGVQGPGSDQGFYYPNRADVNKRCGQYGLAIGIFSNDPRVKLLGTLSTLYIKVLDFMNLE